MAIPIHASRDFRIGLLYLAIGAAALFAGDAYSVGTAKHMGPGYFPNLLAWLLIGFGGISILRAVWKRGEAMAPVTVRAPLLVLGSILALAFLLDRVGGVLALAVMLGLSGAACRENRPDLTAVLIGIGVIVFCILVFVCGLGIPIPLYGVLAG